MKRFVPAKITESELLSSTIDMDADANVYGVAWRGEWNPDQPGGYTVGDVVRVGIELFESLIGSNGTTPGENPDNWLHLGKVNRHRCFDNYTNTYAEGIDRVVIELHNLAIDHVGIFEAEAEVLEVEVLDSTGDMTWTTGEIVMEAKEHFIADSYDYFFAPYPPRLRTRDLVVRLGHPLFFTEKVRVTLRGTGRIRLAMLHVGYADYLGGVRYTPEVGAYGYGVVDEDRWGRRLVVKGPKVKHARGEIRIPKGSEDAVFRLLAESIDTPCVWDFNGDGGGKKYEMFVMYGLLEDFREVLRGPNATIATLEIKGVVGVIQSQN